jgi:hypothetical protein
MTVTARRLADKKAWRNDRNEVGTRQSLSLPNMFSILFRWR